MLATDRHNHRNIQGLLAHTHRASTNKLSGLTLSGHSVLSRLESHDSIHCSCQMNIGFDQAGRIDHLNLTVCMYVRVVCVCVRDCVHKW